MTKSVCENYPLHELSNKQLRYNSFRYSVAFRLLCLAFCKNGFSMKSCVIGNTSLLVTVATFFRWISMTAAQSVYQNDCCRTTSTTPVFTSYVIGFNSLTTILRATEYNRKRNRRRNNLSFCTQDSVAMWHATARSRRRTEIASWNRLHTVADESIVSTVTCDEPGGEQSPNLALSRQLNGTSRHCLPTWPVLVVVICGIAIRSPDKIVR